MNLFKYLMTASAVLLITVGTTAQTKSDIPAYRAKGYAGSVSFTDQYLVWMGFDTSHGYMFNEHHYLGGGAGFFLAPIDDIPPTLFTSSVNTRHTSLRKAVPRLQESEQDYAQQSPDSTAETNLCTPMNLNLTSDGTGA